jgi:histidine triad (HIT) family protein
MTATEACIFCRIAADGAEHEVIARSERAIAFMNAYPAGYGHVLVIPKAHAENIWDVSEEDATSVWQLARRVASAARDGLEAQGLNLFQTNGRVAWQSVFHFHVHVVPRWAGDALAPNWTEPLGNRAEITRAAVELRGALGN